VTVPGPTRLVLLRAGKYDYGEVELTRPLHLIGPNNVGKTSLIATLQFLYIDDQRQMHFSRELSETRRYYFPDADSYVLFECMTPTGFQVFGVHGLGPLKQYEIQRFAFQGRFEREDFLDEARRVRAGDEIRARLAPRGYALLEPRQLRAALTGIGESRGVHLGLVPLRHRDQYERFRAMFRNLLRLAHLRQEDLKEFFIEIHSGEFQQKGIDLERDYLGQYEKVRRGTDELRDLRSIEPEARRVLALAEVRDHLRGELPALWQRLLEAYAEEEEQAAAESSRLDARRSECAAAQSRTEAERAQLQERLRGAAEERGAVSLKLSELEASGREFADFLPDFERQRQRNLEGQLEELGARLRSAQAEPVSRVKNRVERNEREFAARTSLLRRISSTVAARLGPRWAATELDDLFRVLNPAVLGLPEGEQGVEVRSPALLEARLRTILSGVARGVYADEAVRLVLSQLPGPDLGMYTDPARVEEAVAELARDLERDRLMLAAAENAERLREERERLRSEQKACVRGLFRHEQFLDSKAQEGSWRSRHDALLAEERTTGEALQALDRRRDELVEELRQLSAKLRELERERQRRRESVQRLTAPDPAWPLLPLDDLPVSLGLLLSRYEEDHREERRASHELTDGLGTIQARTYGRYDRGTEPESLGVVREELEAMEERTRAVQELWKGLAASLRSAFTALHRDLETLESRVDELNRSLAGVSVSNLARLRLIVREHPEWVKRIRTIATEDEMPLFSDRGAVDAAFGQLGEFLAHYPRVRLFDLFSLHFEVTTPDGASRTYPQLETIESNGTTITIKVLINLMLLRGLFGKKEVLLPFYLDEVASLDHENLAGIVKKSLELGFVPALASPEAMDAADNLYFLSEHRGRVLLEPRTALLRIRREGGAFDGS
jgi:hypothetical protein